MLPPSPPLPLDAPPAVSYSSALPRIHLKSVRRRVSCRLTQWDPEGRNATTKHGADHRATHRGCSWQNEAMTCQRIAIVSHGRDALQTRRPHLRSKSRSRIEELRTRRTDSSAGVSVVQPSVTIVDSTTYRHSLRAQLPNGRSRSREKAAQQRFLGLGLTRHDDHHWQQRATIAHRHVHCNRNTSVTRGCSSNSRNSDTCSPRGVRRFECPAREWDCWGGRGCICCLQ